MEKTVEVVLAGRGFEVVSWRDWEEAPEKYGDELLLTNAPFKTIYGHPGRSEFLLKSARYDLDIRIECKWQQSSGSVDEKFPYLLLNCIEQMPERTIFIIVDGGGAKPGAVRWLREAAASGKFQEENRDKEIVVMNLSEFLVWVNSTLRG